MKPELLYNLLPAVHRQVDEQSGYALRALLGVIDDAREGMERSIDKLYDDWFIESCDEAVLPHLAALVGADVASATRSVVANTIALRTRKGTAVALQQRIADVLGWHALILPAPADTAKPLLRVWRQYAYPVRQATPHRERTGCYTFHALGVSTPLLNRPAPRRAADQACTLANMPFRIQPTDTADVQPTSIHIEAILRGKEATALNFIFGNLADWDAPRTFGTAEAIVDPQLGRFAVRSEFYAAKFTASYAYGSAADLGGGPYPRQLADTSGGKWTAFVHQAAGAEFADANLFPTLAAALQAFRNAGADGVIRILDSATYAEEETLVGEQPRPGIVLAGSHHGRRHLTIEAESGSVPCLRGILSVHGGSRGLSVTLSGLWIDGPILSDGNLDLHLDHCTVRPGHSGHGHHAAEERRPHRHLLHSIQAAAGSQPHLQVTLSYTIAGAVRMPPTARALHIRNSIVDGCGTTAVAGPNGPGPITYLQSSTVLGAIHVVEQKAMDTAVVVDASAVISSTYGDPDYAVPKNGAGQDVGVFQKQGAARVSAQLEGVLAEFLPAGMQVDTMFES